MRPRQIWECPKCGQRKKTLEDQSHVFCQRCGDRMRRLAKMNGLIITVEKAGNEH